MTTTLTLPASIRTQIGKNANRKLRAQGIIPAVFYTPTGENKTIQVNEANLMKVYGVTGRTTIINLEIEENGKKTVQPCLVWDVEKYPTKNRFQHIDFYGVDLEKELRVRMEVEFTGVAKGTKLGGKLEVYREQIYILSKPADLPKKIIVDISDLDVGQGMRVADLPMPAGVRASYDSNFAILNVIMPGGKAEEEEKNGK